MRGLVSFGFLAPPVLFITLCLIGALAAPVWRRAGVAVALASSLCLFAMATPALSSFLLRRVESRLPENPELSRAQAIVVLGGAVRIGDGAAIPDRLGALSLERVEMAAEAYRRLHLPVLVTGGPDPGGHTPCAGLMKAALEADFAVPVSWSEERSRTTWENAVLSADILRPAQIERVVLVSQAWHLPRALWAFERAGLEPMPWPAPRTALHASRIEEFLPNATAIQDSFNALHELIGSLWYRLRY